MPLKICISDIKTHKKNTKESTMMFTDRYALLEYEVRMSRRQIKDLTVKSNTKKV